MALLKAIAWLLPASQMKNKLLVLLGFDIAPTAVIGPSIVSGVTRFEVGEGAYLGTFNVFRGLRHIRLEDQARIESWNWVSAHPNFREIDPEAGTLFLGRRSKIGSRCYLDASGTIAIRRYAAVGGNRCFLQTHQPDFEQAVQTAGRITVGHHTLVGSCAVILKNSMVPDMSLLAANSTMLEHSAPDGRPGLYAGSPAKWKRETKGLWFERTATFMSEHAIDGQQGILPADIETTEDHID
ncbi:acyltransferase [Gordonia sp. NPDC003422]